MKHFAFIDGQNLNLGIQSCGWKLDFRKFRVYLRDKWTIEKAYLFIGYMPGNESLYQALQEYGYILVFKPTLTGKDAAIKGNCDAELVLHCMIQKDNFSKAIIVSGDGDFYCLIEYLEQHKKLLLIGVPNEKKYSALLRRYR
jgi:uncharacterized LabA/DUF88 family protein